MVYAFLTSLPRVYENFVNMPLSFSHFSNKGPVHKKIIMLVAHAIGLVVMASTAAATVTPLFNYDRL